MPGGPDTVVDFYIVSISPAPLSHPVVNTINTASLAVTVEYNTVYSVNVTSVNCAGMSEMLISPRSIEYSESLVDTIAIVRM